MIGPSAGPLRILHLEDSDLDAELIEAELESLGHPVAIERVMTRDAFARAAVAGRHDLILADYVLPTFDGVSAPLPIFPPPSILPHLSRGSPPETSEGCGAAVLHCLRSTSSTTG